MLQLELSPHLISVTTDFEVMGINFVFKYQVVVAFEYRVAGKFGSRKA